MRYRLYIVTIGLSLPISVLASCLVTPLNEEVASASAVFIATITTAQMTKTPAELHDKEIYSVQYSFEVNRSFKGDPKTVSALTTKARFHDPSDNIFWVASEQSRFVPGDSILVVAKRAGDVQVGPFGCTASRPWDAETQRFLVSILAPAPN